MEAAMQLTALAIAFVLGMLAEHEPAVTPLGERDDGTHHTD